MGGPKESALMQFAFSERASLWKSVREQSLIFAGALFFILLDNFLRTVSHEIAPPLSTFAGFTLACTLRYSWRAFPAPIVAILLVFLFSLDEPLPTFRRLSILLATTAIYPLLHNTWQKREITFLRVRDILFPFVVCAILIACLATLLILVLASQTGLIVDHEGSVVLFLNFPSILAGITIFAPGIYLSLQDRSHLSPLHRPIWENILSSLALAVVIIVAGSINGAHRSDMELLSVALFPVLAWIALRNGLRPVSIAMAIGTLGVLLVRIFYGPGMWVRSPLNDTTYYSIQYLIAVVCLILGTQRDTITHGEIKARLALAATDFCPWDWTYKGGVIFRSPAWTNKVGLAADIPIPLPDWIATVHPDEHEGFAKSIAAGASSEHSSFNMRFRSKDVHTDQWFWSKSIGLILKRDVLGRPLQAIGVVIDIHDAIESEDTRIGLIQREAELSELRAQLNPHFLFNCLNSIRALVEKDPTHAREMITMLSGLLRYLLRSTNRNFDTVEAEMAVVMKYLNLEKVRFGDRMTVSAAVDPDSLQCNVPGMLVLTLVENAIKHGISKLEHGGSIRIETQLSHKALTIRVLNSGKLEALEKGVGLENTRRRVHLLAGSMAGFDIREIRDGLVCATLILPRESLNLSAVSPGKPAYSASRL